MNKTWSLTFGVHTYELDRQQRVSIRAVCSYLIETAGQQTHEIGYSIAQLLEKNRSWFFSRFLLRMESYPGWRERITVETWPTENQKLLALREWRLYSGPQLIGLATSGWLMIDLHKRRPLRPESYPDWKRFLHPERSIAHTFGRLPEPGDPAEALHAQEFRVRFSDVDVNGHANYLSFIDWILEAVPPSTRDEARIAEFEVHFLREANHGEELASRARQIEDARIHPIVRREDPAPAGKQFLHSLVRKADGAELVRARTVWAINTA
jgi:medium-chain acyl-[acyl-carrier-protein] hydrolase